MLDFDYLCGRATPSVAAIVQPGSSGFQKLFFGREEIAIPMASTHPACSFLQVSFQEPPSPQPHPNCLPPSLQVGSLAEACAAHPKADVVVNFASFRRCPAAAPPIPWLQHAPKTCCMPALGDLYHCVGAAFGGKLQTWSLSTRFLARSQPPLPQCL